MACSTCNTPTHITDSCVVAGFSGLWVSSSGWADVNMTDLQTGLAAQVLRNRISCVDFFCDHAQQAAKLVLAAGGRYLITAVHQHWEGLPHFQMAAVSGNSSAE